LRPSRAPGSPSQVSKAGAVPEPSGSNGSSPPNGAAPRLRLLIVEDELMVAWDLGDTVRGLGHEVCATVATQSAAVAAALHFRPNVILMDYRLAEGEGISAARRIRESLNTPVIFCTAYVERLLPDVQSLAPFELLGKPVRPSHLREALARLLAP